LPKVFYPQEDGGGGLAHCRTSKYAGGSLIVGFIPQATVVTCTRTVSALNPASIVRILISHYNCCADAKSARQG